MEIVLTRHGAARLASRVVIKNGVAEHCLKAFKEGEVLFSKSTCNSMAVLHNGVVYIFGLNKLKTSPVLVSAYPFIDANGRSSRKTKYCFKTFNDGKQRKMRKRKDREWK